MAKNGKKKKAYKSIKFKWRLFQFTGGVLFVFVIINFVFQLFHKPTELLTLVSTDQPKVPRQTWMDYKSSFLSHATSSITPTFLAALVQTESGGNPLASPEWKIKRKKSWFSWFAPASSSVGLVQFTKSTYEQAKQFCIHNGQVQLDGPWYKPNSCWFNFLYTRVWPSHAIEMTSGYLDFHVHKIIGDQKISLKNKTRLASVIHLCGVEKAKRFYSQNFALVSLRNCGSHSASRYIRKIEKLENQFRKYNPSIRPL